MRKKNIRPTVYYFFLGYAFRVELRRRSKWRCSVVQGGSGFVWAFWRAAREGYLPGRFGSSLLLSLWSSGSERGRGGKEEGERAGVKANVKRVRRR